MRPAIHMAPAIPGVQTPVPRHVPEIPAHRSQVEFAAALDIARAASTAHPNHLDEKSAQPHGDVRRISVSPADPSSKHVEQTRKGPESPHLEPLESSTAAAPADAASTQTKDVPAQAGMSMANAFTRLAPESSEPPGARSEAPAARTEKTPNLLDDARGSDGDVPGTGSTLGASGELEFALERLHARLERVETHLPPARQREWIEPQRQPASPVDEGHPTSGHDDQRAVPFSPTTGSVGGDEKQPSTQAEAPQDVPLPTGQATYDSIKETESVEPAPAPSEAYQQPALATPSPVRLIKLQLTPPDLGTVHLTLRGVANTVSVKIETESAGAARSMQHGQEQLAAALLSAGYVVDNLEIKPVQAEPNGASGEKEKRPLQQEGGRNGSGNGEARGNENGRSGARSRKPARPSPVAGRRA